MTSQHDRDSRELRELCAQRDAARATVRQQAERIAELETERDQHQHTATSLLSLLADIRKACGDNGKRMQPELVELIGELATERERLRAEVERLRAEREHWHASFQHVSEVLIRIHALMYPEPFTLSDGRTLVFRPKDPGPHEILQALSDRIRAIPDEVAAIAARTTHKDEG